MACFPGAALRFSAPATRSCQPVCGFLDCPSFLATFFYLLSNILAHQACWNQRVPCINESTTIPMRYLPRSPLLPSPTRTSPHSSPNWERCSRLALLCLSRSCQLLTVTVAAPALQMDCPNLLCFSCSCPTATSPFPFLICTPTTCYQPLSLQTDCPILFCFSCSCHLLPATFHCPALQTDCPDPLFLLFLFCLLCRWAAPFFGLILSLPIESHPGCRRWWIKGWRGCPYLGPRF